MERIDQEGGSEFPKRGCRGGELTSSVRQRAYHIDQNQTALHPIPAKRPLHLGEDLG